MKGFYFYFFFQAEDGIRDDLVTGVQTCALPICTGRPQLVVDGLHPDRPVPLGDALLVRDPGQPTGQATGYEDDRLSRAFTVVAEHSRLHRPISFDGPSDPRGPGGIAIIHRRRPPMVHAVGATGRACGAVLPPARIDA